jgi:hypothetical protein
MTPPPDNPFAVWTIFHGIHRWYFGRGCPPTIAALRGWQRALAVSVLLATLGLTASLCGLAAVWLLGPSRVRWGSTILGSCLGGLLLLPVSRWIGRPWWLALLAVPFCALWFWLIDDVWNYYRGAFSQVRGKNYDVLVWWASMTTMGLGITGWMASPFKARSWLLPPAAAAASTIAAIVYYWGTKSSMTLLLPNTLGQLLNFVVMVQPVMLFLTLTSAALGIRLWWPDDAAAHPSPRPAANTAETSTANPGSSTDVADSPVLNSP